MQEGNTSPIGKFFRNKWVWLIGAIDIIFLIVIIIVAVAIPVSQSIQNATISFNIVPMTANISVNGSGDYESNGEAYSLTPGYYDITISYPNLTSKTFSMNLEENTNTTITTFLTDDDFNYYKLRDNYGAFLALSNIASAGDNQTTDHDTSAETFITDYQEQYKLYSTELPIEYRETTGVGRDTILLKDITIKAAYKCEVMLCIDALMSGTDDKELIAKLLQEKGIKAEEYEINYKIYQ